MDHSIQIPKDLLNTPDYQSLGKLLDDIIKQIDCYRKILIDKTGDITISLDQLELGNNSMINKRDIAVDRGKIEIVDTTLSSLYVICKYLKEASNLQELLLKCPNYRIDKTGCIRLFDDWLELDIFIGIIASFIQRSSQNCKTQLDYLDSGYKSPFDFSSITQKLLKSLENVANADTIIQVESLLKLAQSELIVVKEARNLNEGQQKLITIYCDKLNLLNNELSSVGKGTESKPKEKAKKMRDIVNGIRLIVKDFYELIKTLESVDWINESDEVFEKINGKGADAFDDVIDYMENIKKEWTEKEIVNETTKVCRLAALRKFNIHLKQIKKLSAIKSQLESEWIVLGMKNITTSFNQIKKFSSMIAYSAYYMTHRCLPKPTVDVPDGFIRDDIIYDELNTISHQGLLIVLVHIIKYLTYLNSLTWNKFQGRKPRKVCDDFRGFLEIIEDSVASYLDEDELQSISFDLADRLCLAKIKIATDRDALEYRFFRYKAKKLFKFDELQKILNRPYGPRPYRKVYYVREYMEEHFDEIIGRFNRKVSNCGQMIIFKSGMEMMKQSFRTSYLMKCADLEDDEMYLCDLLINQSVNEFCYAVETLDKLLTSFRPNRRIPFSFNTDGQFTQKINEIGLEMKQDFEVKVNYLIEKLKEKIKEKEAQLESTKEERTQLRYLTSILKRSKLVPINELELTEKDQVDILKEIIEEYEYTMIVYEPVD